MSSEKRSTTGPAESGDLKRLRIERQWKITRKRKRPRTKGLRQHLVLEIERLLKTAPSPAAHLFTSVNEAGVPHAPLNELLPLLPVDQKKVKSLSTQALIQASNLTTTFAIENGIDDRLMVAYRPSGPSVEQCTVFLDNLPSSCNPEKLGRLLRKFGTVVEIRLPRTPSREVILPVGPMEMGRHRRACAFVQFTNVEAVDAIVQEYDFDADSPPARNVLCILQLKRQIRRLGTKGRKRRRWETMQLVHLRRRLHLLHYREFKQRRKTRRAHVAAARANRSANNSHLTDGHSEHPSTSRAFGEPNGILAKRKISKRKRSSIFKNGAKSGQDQIRNAKRKRRRIRRRDPTNPAYIKDTVAIYFSSIRAMKFTRYQELRNEYLAQRKHQRSIESSTHLIRGVNIGKTKPSTMSAEVRDGLWRASGDSAASDSSPSPLR